MTTITQVERPFTATQQRSLRGSADPEVPEPIERTVTLSPTQFAPVTGSHRGFEPPHEPGGPGDLDDEDPDPPRQGRPGGPEDPDGPDGPGDNNSDSDDSSDSTPKISNEDLARAILSLSKGKQKSTKIPYKPHAPETFDGSTEGKLRAFIFQCRIYFNA